MLLACKGLLKIEFENDCSNQFFLSVCKEHFVSNQNQMQNYRSGCTKRSIIFLMFTKFEIKWNVTEQLASNHNDNFC